MAVGLVSLVALASRELTLRAVLRRRLAADQAIRDGLPAGPLRDQVHERVLRDAARLVVNPAPGGLSRRESVSNALLMAATPLMVYDFWTNGPRWGVPFLIVAVLGYVLGTASSWLRRRREAVEALLAAQRETEPQD